MSASTIAKSAPTTACEHSGVTETEESVVCLSCGLVLQPRYARIELARAKNPPYEFEKLSELLKDVCDRFHIASSTCQRACDYLSHPRVKLLMRPGRSHSPFRKKNISIAAFLLFTSLCEEETPVSMKHIGFMFGLDSQNIKTSDVWQLGNKLNGINNGRDRGAVSPPPPPSPSTFLRYFLAAADALDLLKGASRGQVLMLGRLANQFAEAGNFNPRVVMAAALSLKIRSKNRRQELLEASFSSPSTMSRLRRKIALFRRKKHGPL